MQEIGLSCMWWYPHDGFIIACERPSVICVDAVQRLHNDTGPAIAFRDGWQIYAVHGVRVPDWIIKSPDQITTAKIEAEKNTEIQRVMIERFGWDRYVTTAGFELLDQHERWGTLWRRGEYLVLEVINRSPEPDGSFRKYMLPVAPGCAPLGETLGAPQQLTALNAVASTFGMIGEDYARLVDAES